MEWRDLKRDPPKDGEIVDAWDEGEHRRWTDISFTKGLSSVPEKSLSWRTRFTHWMPKPLPPIYEELSKNA